MPDSSLIESNQALHCGGAEAIRGPFDHVGDENAPHSIHLVNVGKLGLRKQAEKINIKKKITPNENLQPPTAF